MSGQVGHLPNHNKLAWKHNSAMFALHKTGDKIYDPSLRFLDILPSEVDFFRIILPMLDDNDQRAEEDDIADFDDGTDDDFEEDLDDNIADASDDDY